MYQRAKDSWGTVFLFITSSIIEAPKGATHFAQAGDSKVAKAALTIMEAKEANKAKVAEDNGLSAVSALLGKEGPRDEGNPDQPSVESKEDVLGHLPQHLRLVACLPWWQKMAPLAVVDLISHGVQGPWLEPPPSRRGTKSTVLTRFNSAKPSFRITLLQER